MKNWLIKLLDWLIKLLGGYTKQQVVSLHVSHLSEVRRLLGKIGELQKKLAQAQKNDTPRDPKTGRFVKK